MIAADKLRPAVPIRKSVNHEYLVCLDCGLKTKTLKRHLRTVHELSPAAYKAKWRLPADYPITAPAYSEERSAYAKSVGLGRRPGKPPATRRNRTSA